MIAWSRFYPVFFTAVKTTAEEAKLFSPPLYSDSIVVVISFSSVVPGF
jgi:hypothetical protein